MKAMWMVEDPRPIARILVDRGLLEPVGERFQMHALLVAHAQSLLSDDDDATPFVTLFSVMPHITEECYRQPNVSTREMLTTDYDTSI